MKCNRLGHIEERCWIDIKCEHCGNMGHPTTLCWNHEGNQNPEWAQTMCSYCGRTGHRSEKFMKKNKEITPASVKHVALMTCDNNEDL